MSDALLQALSTAAAHPAVRPAILAIYADLQSAIDIRRPLCSTSGRCCRFEEFGHRLYITTAELAVFLSDLSPPSSANLNPDPTACPFQLHGLCSVHPLRPFGCRIFFCDETAQSWQEDQYAHFHARLKQLHHDLDIPYFYLEWRQALAAVGLRPEPPTASPRSLPIL